MAVVEVPIKNAGGATAKVRNPVNVALLGLVTCGIYYVYWYWQVNQELVDLGRAKGTNELGDNAQNSLLAIFPGACAIVPPIISYLNFGKRLEAAQRLTGRGEADAMTSFLLLWLLGFVGAWYVQGNLNQIWEAEGEGGAAALQQVTGGGGEVPAPPAETQQQAPPPPPEGGGQA